MRVEADATVTQRPHLNQADVVTVGSHWNRKFVASAKRGYCRNVQTQSILTGNDQVTLQESSNSVPQSPETSKFTLQSAMKAERGSSIIALLSLTSALHGGGWSRPRPGRFTPGKVTRHPMYRRLGGQQGRSGEEQKISSPHPTPPHPGFGHRTVPPVTSRYADHDIPAHPNSPASFKSVEEKLRKMEEVGCSEIFKDSFSNARRYSHEDSTVWLCNSGIHRAGKRRGGDV
jgi:hypothetical protein